MLGKSDFNSTTTSKLPYSSTSMRPRFSLFGNYTIILVDSNVIQGDSYYIDRSQSTRNQDSFNIENTTITRQMIPLDGQLISWLDCLVHN